MQHLAAGCLQGGAGWGGVGRSGSCLTGSYIAGLNLAGFCLGGANSKCLTISTTAAAPQGPIEHAPHRTTHTHPTPHTSTLCPSAIHTSLLFCHFISHHFISPVHTSSTKVDRSGGLFFSRRRSFAAPSGCNAYAPIQTLLDS
mgnify:CR=1 FL=1